MVAQYNTLAFGAARKACMCPKEALCQLSNYWWLSRLAVHCRLHQASVHQTSDQTRLPVFTYVKISLDNVHILRKKKEFITDEER
jgi:hypothetical protein